MDADPEVEIVEPRSKTSLQTENSGEKVTTEDRTKDDSDQDLDDLLDESLGEFGKHIPFLNPVQMNSCPPSSGQVNNTQSSSSSSQPFLGDSTEFDDIFSSEFAAEAEAQLGEAMKVLSSENPELWQQFETITKSMHLEDLGMGSIPPQPSPSGAATKGESSVDGASGNGIEKASEGPRKSNSGSLDQKIEETMRRLQDNAAQLGPNPSHMEGLGGLEGMLGQLDVNSEEGEDQFLMMMQGMMSTLLSKDVLYPSLMELRKQYPDWLSSNRDKISEEDYQRYSKQLEVMTEICREFEKTEGDSSQDTSANILQLMQQLQKCGQPPGDLAGENRGEMPLGIQNMMGNLDPQNCTVM